MTIPNRGGLKVLKERLTYMTELTVSMTIPNRDGLKDSLKIFNIKMD